MRIFKNAWFERFARKQRIDDDALREAIRRAEQGLIDQHILSLSDEHLDAMIDKGQFSEVDGNG